MLMKINKHDSWLWSNRPKNQKCNDPDIYLFLLKDKILHFSLKQTKNTTTMDYFTKKVTLKPPKNNKKDPWKNL